MPNISIVYVDQSINGWCSCISSRTIEKFTSMRRPKMGWSTVSLLKNPNSRMGQCRLNRSHFYLFSLCWATMAETCARLLLKFAVCCTRSLICINLASKPWHIQSICHPLCSWPPSSYVPIHPHISLWMLLRLIMCPNYILVLFFIVPIMSSCFAISRTTSFVIFSLQNMFIIFRFAHTSTLFLPRQLAPRCSSYFPAPVQVGEFSYFF